MRPVTPAARRHLSAAVSVSRYQCRWCGYVYDPAKGESQRNTPAGTPFEDLPEDWRCPDCRAPKADFDPLAEG